MAFLNQELAIDLGTANTVIYQNGQIVLDEPSMIAVDNNTGKCIALGQQAKLMDGKVFKGSVGHQELAAWVEGLGLLESHESEVMYGF